MKKRLTVILVIALISASLFASYIPNNKEDVNAFDRLVMNNYSKPLDKSASVLNAALLISPLSLAIGRTGDDILTLGVMYLETIGGAYGTKELLKAVINRPRPYTYFEGAPEEKMDDWNKSFPSGHTTMAFASAGFTSVVFSKYYPNSKWKIPVIVASYSLATITATMRLMSGNHFFTDVIAGAAIGTLWGIGIPLLHTLGDNVKMGVTPFSLAFSVSL